MLIDYHIHSEFSDDSRTPMEKQIERAIELGLSEICFTDHVDYGIKNDWTDDKIQWRTGDGIGTATEDLDPLTNVHYPEYFAKLYRMKKMYGHRITIHNGLEFGVQTETIPQYKKLIQTYNDQLDFILLSIHQIHNLEFWNGAYMEGRTEEEYVLEYYQELLHVVSSFKDYDVLAHVDLISRYDTQGPFPFDRIKDILKEIFTIVLQDGKGIEINTSSWHYKLNDTTPCRDILKLYHDLGGTIITIGSDAHTPDYLGDHVQDAQRILKEIGFDHFCTFEKHKPVFHELY